MMPQFRARSYANSGYFNNGRAVTDGSIIPGLSR